MSKLDTATLKPGDVVIVEMGIWIVRKLIAVQALFSGNYKYKQNGHVIVVTHRDSENRLWGIEARAGGIGWARLDKYHGKYGVSNVEQPKEDHQRMQIVKTMQSLLGSPYDYTAYLVIGLQTLGITRHWKDYDGNDVSIPFICSAVAAWVYDKQGLANPEGSRFVTPVNWARFVDERGWL